jgi:uncharacterized protein involved in response to NO
MAFLFDSRMDMAFLILLGVIVLKYILKDKESNGLKLLTISGLFWVVEHTFYFMTDIASTDIFNLYRTIMSPILFIVTIIAFVWVIRDLLKS